MPFKYDPNYGMCTTGLGISINKFLGK